MEQAEDGHPFPHFAELEAILGGVIDEGRTCGQWIESDAAESVVKVGKCGV